MTKRFVKTQREMEGRFEDVWALVDEEDDLEIWPDDADLSVVGRPAPRHDGRSPACCAPRRHAAGSRPSTWTPRARRPASAPCSAPTALFR